MKKSILTFSGLVAMAVGTASAQTVYLNEGFSGTGVPAGWTQNTQATDGGYNVGTNVQLQSQYFGVPAFDGNMIGTNDDDCNCNKANEYLITPSIDLTMATSVLLSFDLYYGEGTYQGATENFSVRVSTDNGTTFTLVETIEGAGTWTNRLIDLSAYAGQTIKVGFRYDDGGGWLFGAMLDNIMVSSPADYDVAGISMPVADYVLTDTPLNFAGVVQSLGGEEINSMRLNYSVNGGATVSHDLTGLTIGLTDDYNFSHPTAWTPTAAGPYTISFWVDNINGNMDGNNDNDTITVSTFAAEELAQRKVLFEQFTSSTCGPCASADPTISAYLDANGVNTPTGKVVAAKYHVNIPSACSGTTAETQARQTFYGVNSAPRALLNGNAYNGHPLNITQAMIDAQYDRPAIFTINPTATFQNNNITVEVDVTSMVDFTGAGNSLYVAVFEKNIARSYFATASTSQQNFKYVVRKMLPNANGTNMPNMTTGQSQTFTLNNTLTTMMVGDMGNIEVVAFIQNNTTREVYQAAHATFTGNLNTEGFSVDPLAVTAFPNPTSNDANLVFTTQSKNVSVQVINALGQVVLTQEIGAVDGSKVINIPADVLANGLYTINVITAEGLSSSTRLSVVK